MKKYFPEFIGILICLCIVILAGTATSLSDFNWYAALTKPSFNPPNWIFGPVWVVLYILIGIAMGKLWRIRKESPITFSIFLIQLFMNLLWSYLFFQYHRVDLALYDIAILWFSIMTLWLMVFKRKTIFYLLLPYGLWVSFAFLLNIMIFTLNYPLQ